MNHNKLIKSTLMSTLSLIMAYSSLSLATDNKAMQADGYFNVESYAKQNKPAHAISEYRYQLNLNSLDQGLAVDSIPLLKAKAGLGRERIMSTLLENLSKLDFNIDAKSVVNENETDKRLAVYGDGWKLKVYGDGSRVAFRNYGYLDRNEEAINELKRIEPEELEKLGRRFIAEYLGDFIPMGKKEELIPFGVQYQVNTQQSVEKNAKKEEQTVAGTIIFSRKINGIDVLGKGSKIAILYANDGTPFGFDFDWPALDSIGEEQKIAPLNEIKQRAVEVAKLATDAVNVQLERFECGYYDAGQSKRGEAPIQSGCFHFYSAQSFAKSDDTAGFLTMAFVDPIPASNKIINDPNWDTAIELLNGRDAVPERAKSGENSIERENMQEQIESFKEEEPI